MRNRPSLTAEYMALFRALESSRSASSRLFYDPLAGTFLHGWRRWLYRTAAFNPGRRFLEQVLDRNAPGARASGIARTKWIDDKAIAALEVSKQLVLLGAGFDTRAYRLPAARPATTYELDYPDTSVAKQCALKKAIGSLPAGVRFIGIDFNRQSIADVLTEAGFDKTRPACFIWEGVTTYLTERAVDNVLREICRSGSGSILLFTYIDRGVLEEPERYFGAVEMLRRLRSYGEPWTFGLDPDEIEAYLAARGFELLADTGVAEVWKDMGRRPSEIHGYEFYRLASARVH